MDLSSFVLTAGSHKGKDVIWIQFSKNQVLLDSLRERVHVLWSSTRKCWYTIDTAHNRALLGLEAKLVGKAALDKIDEVNKAALNEYMAHLKLKAYGPNTIRYYVIGFSQLLSILKSLCTTPQYSDQRLS